MRRSYAIALGLILSFAVACTPQLKVEGLSVVETFCLKYDAVGTDGLSGDAVKLDTIEGNDAVWYEDCFLPEPGEGGQNTEGDGVVEGSLKWFQKQVDLIVGEDQPEVTPVEPVKPVIEVEPEAAPEKSGSSGAAVLRILGVDEAPTKGAD